MHSHHSHSGDYVSHALDTLETITQKAIDMGFKTFCLTEHQPRTDDKLMYPEEHDKHYTVHNLQENFDNFITHARQIQKRASDDPTIKTKFLVGFEVEGADDEHIDSSVALLELGKFDMCVGSVHYVHSIPIDFNQELWHEAVESCGGSIHHLFEEYYDLQYLMLAKIKPVVVGHFDLIKLMCGDDVVDSEITGKKVKSEVNIEKEWPKVWAKIIRNIKFVESYGGLFELNSAAIRKGWSTPYPGVDIAEAIIKYGGGRFCLSDDSHSIAQVGLNFHKVLDYVDNTLKLDKLYYVDVENSKTVVRSETIEEIKHDSFWKQYQ